MEFLESRCLLSASEADILATLCAQMTPNPHPSGDLPADTSQVTPLANYTPAMVPPDPGTDPALTQFILAVQGIYDGIAANTADRPAYWGENVATGTGIFCPPVRCNTLRAEHGALSQLDTARRVG